MKSKVIARVGNTEIWKYEDKGQILIKTKEARKLEKAEKLVKADDGLMVTTGVAFSAYRIDSDDEYYTPSDIEKAAIDYMADSQVVGLQHSGKQTDARLVESYLVPYPTQADHDAAMQGKEHRVLKMIFDKGHTYSGDWVTSVKHTPETWKAVKAGKLTGISPGFYAERVEAKESDIPKVTEIIEIDLREGGTPSLKTIKPDLKGFFARGEI